MSSTTPIHTATFTDPTAPWTKMEMFNTHFVYYAKTTATKKQIDDFLENKWGSQDDDEFYWDWRGFGELGKEGFSVVVLKKVNYRC